MYRTSDLPSTIRCLYPDAATIDLDMIYRALDWTPRSTARPFLGLNMVSSADGRATLGGSAAGLGSPVDQYLMRVLRAQADVLLHGAGTIRADHMGTAVPANLVPERVARGLRPQPLMAILSVSGDLPLEDLAAHADEVIVFVAERTPAERRARLSRHVRVWVAGNDQPDPAMVVRVLGDEFGARHVLCEGGPTLNRALLAAGVLDELYLTLSPKLLAGDGLPLVKGPALDPATRLSLLSLYEHDDELYLRYMVQRQALA